MRTETKKIIRKVVVQLQVFKDGKIESLTHDDLINKHKLEDHEFESKYLSKKIA